MGTVVSYRLEPGEIGDAAARAALGASIRELHRIDRLFSTFAPDSAMSRFRVGEAVDEVEHEEITSVLRLCGRAREITAGWFDPWAMPGGVDPTGLVKGWAVERAASILARAGVEAALVNGGGDIASVGPATRGQPWRIGIRHPWRQEALACVVELEGGGAVATSGTYERGAHLIDPFTRRRAGARHGALGSVARVVSATVVGPSLALADAMATALAVAGSAGVSVAASLVEAGYESYRISADGREEATSGFPFAAAAAPA
ncbi:MAG TPA: FAD:protein FMN transferase [Acidimicrobiales bacterium]|nr:FAD:protein FMN transferase [Acidimicrobiales bacterium]